MEVVSGAMARNVFISRHQPRKNWTRKWELSSIGLMETLKALE
jgi:hypothetical protein